MKNLKDYLSRTKNRFHDSLYFSDLERAINLTWEKNNIKSPKARALFRIPVSLYLIAKDTFWRTIEFIDIIGEKLFEYPESYYRKKSEREKKEEEIKYNNP
jgi:hypothetical protein